MSTAIPTSTRRRNLLNSAAVPNQQISSKPFLPNGQTPGQPGLPNEQISWQLGPIHYPNGKLACSVDELAELSGICRSSIYLAIRDGSLIARKRGARTIILAPDGMQYLNSLPAVSPRARGADNSKKGA